MKAELVSQSHSEFCRILGVQFFLGTAEEAVCRMKQGGLLAVPAAPALKQLATQAGYRDALLDADLIIPDSGFMVLVWNLLHGRSIARLSGLKYLQALLREADVKESGSTFWVMAREESARKNLQWLESQGIVVPSDCVYTAPLYGEHVHDPELLERIKCKKPQHIILTLGGGTQERLGLYLKRGLGYLPAIHCIGAAIAFLSGDQVRMPAWADKLYLGWAFRCLSHPRQYIPRYWSASELMPLLLKYRSNLPPLRRSGSDIRRKR